MYVCYRPGQPGITLGFSLTLRVPVSLSMLSCVSTELLQQTTPVPHQQGELAWYD